MRFTMEILKTVFAAVWQVTLLYTNLETSDKQFYHCRLKDGTCIFFVFNAHTYMFCACMWVLCICVRVLFMHVWMCVCMCVQLKSCRNFVILCEKDYIIKVYTVWVHSYWNKFRESQEQAYNLSKIYFFSEV